MIPIPQYPDTPLRSPTWADGALDELCATSAKRAAERAFLESIEAWLNRLLPLDTSSAVQWPTSQLLGNVGGGDIGLALFNACVLAMARKDADAAKALRDFAAMAAKEYANDNHEAWL